MKPLTNEDRARFHGMTVEEYTDKFILGFDEEEV